MGKRKRLHQKIADATVSFFVLAVFIIPLLLSAKWIGGMFIHNDSRSVKPAVKFNIRGIDDTKAPLKPFDEPIVTVTFDDGWETVYTNAFSDMQYEGLHSTQFIVTNTFNNPTYMSKAQLHSLQAAGNEIESHTVSHPDLTTLNQSQLIHELKDSRDTLTKEFGPVYDFTTPFGAYNSNTLQQISKYYRSQKNAEGYISSDGLGTINVKKGFNPLNYKSYSVRQTTSLADIKKLLLDNEKYKGWLVFTYHQVDNSGEEYSVTPDNFNKQMRLISDSRSRSATVGQILNILLPKWKPEI
ncbi:MAG: polysaccharide deacetylase family protein [Candidatus Saccharimonadales bacterium]